MGMFDNIRSEYALPKPVDAVELKDFDFNSIHYQTKDLDCTFESYLITSDGKLMHEKFSYESSNDPEHLECDSHFENKLVKKEPELIHKTDFTGAVSFYESLRDCAIKPDEPLKNDYWIEYVALFIKGCIVAIELKEFEVFDSAIRKSRNKELFYKHEKMQSKWYMKYLYTPYEKVIRKLFSTYRRYSSRINSFKIQKWLTPW